MATLNDSVLQGASGKIGGYVTYTVGNKTYARKLADTTATAFGRTNGTTFKAPRSPKPCIVPHEGAYWKKCTRSWRGKRNDAPATTGSFTQT